MCRLSKLGETQSDSELFKILMGLMLIFTTTEDVISIQQNKGETRRWRGGDNHSWTSLLHESKSIICYLRSTASLVHLL